MRRLKKKDSFLIKHKKVFILTIVIILITIISVSGYFFISPLFYKTTTNTSNTDKNNCVISQLSCKLAKLALVKKEKESLNNRISLIFNDKDKISEFLNILNIQNNDNEINQKATLINLMEKSLQSNLPSDRQGIINKLNKLNDEGFTYKFNNSTTTSELYEIFKKHTLQKWFKIIDQLNKNELIPKSLSFKQKMVLKNLLKQNSQSLDHLNQFLQNQFPKFNKFDYTNDINTNINEVLEFWNSLLRHKLLAFNTINKVKAEKQKEYTNLQNEINEWFEQNKNSFVLGGTGFSQEQENDLKLKLTQKFKNVDYLYDFNPKTISFKYDLNRNINEIILFWNNQIKNDTKNRDTIWKNLAKDYIYKFLDETKSLTQRKKYSTNEQLLNTYIKTIHKLYSSKILNFQLPNYPVYSLKEMTQLKEGLTTILLDKLSDFIIDKKIKPTIVTNHMTEIQIILSFWRLELKTFSTKTKMINKLETLPHLDSSVPSISDLQKLDYITLKPIFIKQIFRYNISIIEQFNNLTTASFTNKQQSELNKYLSQINSKNLPYFKTKFFPNTFTTHDEIINYWNNQLQKSSTSKNKLYSQLKKDGFNSIDGIPISILEKEKTYIWSIEKFVSIYYQTFLKSIKDFIQMTKMEYLSTQINDLKTNLKSIENDLSKFSKLYLGIKKTTINEIMDYWNNQLKQQEVTFDELINQFENTRLNLLSFLSIQSLTIEKIKGFSLEKIVNLYRQAWYKKHLNEIKTFFNDIDVDQKIVPYHRDGYRLSCNFGLNEKYELFEQDVNKVDKSFICAFIAKDSKVPLLERVNNEFPIFQFEDVNQELSPIDIKNWDLQTKQFSNSVLLENEKNAKRTALVLVRKMIKGVNFSSEFSLLDSVIIKKSKDGEKNTLGFYSYKTNTLLYDGKRTITLQIPRQVPKIKDGKYVGGLNHIYAKFPNEPDLDSVYFDVRKFINTFNHEYGHHLTTYSGNFSKQILLDRLTALYGSKNGKVNERFKNFVFLYKYFNGMNESPSDNYDANSLSNTGAINAFKTLQKIFGRSVVSIYDEIYNDPNQYPGPIYKNLTKKSSIARQIIKYLEKFKITNPNPNTNPDNPKESANPIDVIKESKVISILEKIKNDSNYVLNLKEEEILKKIHLFFYDKTYNIFSSVEGEKGFDLITQRAYYLTPNVYNSIKNNSKTQLRVKDVFPQAKALLYNPKSQTSSPIVIYGKDNKKLDMDNLLCLNKPLTFGGRHVLEQESIKWINEISKNNIKKYDEKSIEYRSNYLKQIQYFYLYSEILARMHAVLNSKTTFSRPPIRECTFYKSGIKDVNINNKPKKYFVYLIGPNANYISITNDYLFFRAHGFNILEKNMEHTILDLLTNQKRINETNSGYFIQNNKKVYANSNLANSRDYFISISSHINANTNADHNYGNVYALLNLKLSSTIDYKQIRIRYTQNGESYAPVKYDYNHPLYTNNLSGEWATSPNNEVRSSLYGANASNYISLVFKLKILESNDSIEQLDDSFNVKKETIVYVDANANGNYDDGEILVKLM